MHGSSHLVFRLRKALKNLSGRGLLRSIAAYAAHPDPRVEIAAKIAAIVVGNQPFYPLYLFAIFGASGWIGCWTWLTTPFFAAVPALARRNATAGRLLMCGTGMANTILCEKLLGTASGVGWFALPCALLALFTFHAREWRISAPLTLLCAGGGLFAGLLIGPPTLALDGAALSSLTKLHLVSVASLVLVIGYFRIRRVGGP